MCLTENGFRRPVGVIANLTDEWRPPADSTAVSITAWWRRTARPPRAGMNAAVIPRVECPELTVLIAGWGLVEGSPARKVLIPDMAHFWGVGAPVAR